MAKKIVYVEPGDMIEVRVCNPIFDLGANKTAWEESIDPHSHTLVVYGFRGFEVSHLNTEIYAWNPGKPPRQMVPYNPKR